MNMVKREFQNLQKRNEAKKVTSLLSLDCRSSGDGDERVTSLALMHELLVNCDSEYHYLFSLVRDAAQKNTTDYVFLLPNATRKLLEMFATSCSYRIAVILSKHKEVEREKAFLATWCRHFSEVGIGQRYADLVERARKKGAIPAA